MNTEATTYHQNQILLVEDNEADAFLTKQAFKAYNHLIQLVHVLDGQQAIDYLLACNEFESRKDQANPLLVILDIKMPKMDGLEVLKEMRKNEKTESIPVVMFTCSKAYSDLDTCYKYGVNSYVVKPFVLADYEKVVANIGKYWLKIDGC